MNPSIPPILPVLDVQNRQVVRGIAGQRQDYLPIISRLTTSADPLMIARVFRDHFGLQDLYLADLDAICGAPSALDLYATLHEEGFNLWVDAGIRDRASARALALANIDRIIVGLETATGPDLLECLCKVLGPEQIVFSLDLKEGMPLGNRAGWDEGDAWSIAEKAIALGIRYLLVLDLARVGVGQGMGTELLLRRIAATYPDVQLIAGGGVRDIKDVRELHQAGVQGVLVASALHDGAITREDVRGYLAEKTL